MTGERMFKKQMYIAFIFRNYYRFSENYRSSGRYFCQAVRK